MNYENLTKKELIAIINDQKHLAEAIEAKDVEISELNDINDDLHNKVEELTKKVNEQKHLAEAVNQKDKEINRLNSIKAEEIANIKNSTEAIKVSLEYQVQDLTDKLSKVPDLDKIKEHIDNLTNENNLFRTSLSQYINVFKNFLKSQQGVLDNSIELEAMLYEQLTNNNREQIAKNGENK